MERKQANIVEQKKPESLEKMCSYQVDGAKNLDTNEFADTHRSSGFVDKGKCNCLKETFGFIKNENIIFK